MRSLATVITVLATASACFAADIGAAWPEKSVKLMAGSFAKGETLLNEKIIRKLVEVMPELDALRGQSDWAEQSEAVIEAAGFASIDDYVKALQKTMAAATIVTSLRNLEEARAGKCRCKRMIARIARLEASTQKAIADARLTQAELKLVFGHRARIDRAAKGYFAEKVPVPAPAPEADRS